MTVSNGVPPVLRPVLEALVELAYAPLDNEQTAAAWNRIGEACEAALAPDAGTAELPQRGLRAMTEEEMAACEAAAPEGEPFFHRLGCPQISGRGTAAHCTCPPDRPKQSTGGTDGMDAAQLAEQDGAGEGQRADVSVPLRDVDADVATADPAVAPAPDAELDRLLAEYYRAIVRYGDQPGPLRHDQMLDAKSAIHAHVEKVKREARAGRRASGPRHSRSRGAARQGGRVSGGRLTNTEHFTDANGFPVDLVRREKEEG